MRTMRMTRPLPALSLAAVLLTLSPTRAADDGAVFKTYDLSDLVRAARDYPLPDAVAAKPGGGKRAAAFVGAKAEEGKFVNANAVPAASTEDEWMDHYISAIREMVAVGTWKEDGGSIGSLRPLPDRSIIVSQTPAAHEEIAKLLTQLREQSSRRVMVRVRASWMVIDPKAVDAAKASDPVTPRSVTPADDKVQDALFDNAETYRQAELTCYNGQTVGIQSGTDTAYVSDVTPVVGTNAVGYDTTVDKAFSGVRLQVTPQLIPGGNAVVLDLQSTVSETSFITSPVAATTNGPATRPFVERKAADGVADGTKVKEVDIDGPADVGPGSATNAIAFIQRPQVSDQSFGTTVRVPLGRRVIVAGMTMPTEAKRDAALPKDVDFKKAVAADNTNGMAGVGAKPRTLYLVVRVDAVQ